MTVFPDLPDPAANQPPENRRIMGERFILQARKELEEGNRLQAGEKAWGAAVQYLKIIAEKRGWNHTSNRELESVGKQLAAEYQEYGVQLAAALSDAYHKGHENFYENRRSFSDVEGAVEGMEEALPVLDSLANEEPRRFTIDTNSQLRRLRLITGNHGLQRGNTSPVGFSLRHGYNTDGPPAGVIRENPQREPSQIQPLVRGLMTTLLEDFPGLVSENDRMNLMNVGYCEGSLGLQLGGYPLLRRREQGRMDGSRYRYWQKVYAGRYYVTNNWWRQHHHHNAGALMCWAEQLIDRGEGQPGIAALQRRRDALRAYLQTDNSPKPG